MIPSTSSADVVVKVFLFTLKDRFSERGARIVENGKFALLDTALMRDINL
jgi:hypothetical protein